jgi:hypothetical protein
MILREQLTGAADERLALHVFVGARRLADEHQVRVGIADAEDDLRAAERSSVQRVQSPMSRAALRARGGSRPRRVRAGRPRRVLSARPRRGLGGRTRVARAHAPRGVARDAVDPELAIAAGDVGDGRGRS